MSYESTDYRQNRDPAARGTRGAVPGEGRYPMDVPRSGSGKGLLIALVVLVAFIAFVALISIGGDPETGPTGLQTPPPQAIPESGTAGGVEITPAPTAPVQSD